MVWSLIDTVIVIGYLSFLMCLGFLFSKRHISSNDYFIASRRIPSFIAALSVYATALSSISYVAITSNIYKNGWIFGIGVLSVIPLIFLVSHFFIPFIRRINAITTYEYIEARFNRPMRLMASAIFILFNIVRIAIVIYIPTIAITSVWQNVNPYMIVCLIGFLCVIYTTVGGFEAIVWADAIQAFILVSGALLVIFFGFRVVPSGVDPFAVMVADGKIFPAENFSFNPKETTIWWLMIGGFFASIYQYIGSQDITQRYSSTKTLAEAKKTLYLQIPLLFTSLFIFIGMGSAIYIFYKYSGFSSPNLSNYNAILPYFVINHLPIGIKGIIIAGIFAAAQSTVSSSLNSSATCVIVDFISPIRHITESRKINYARIISWLLGIISTMITMHFIVAGQSDMYVFFNSTLGLLAGPIAGVFLLGIFSNRVSSLSAWIGFIFSSCVAIYLGNPGEILTLIPGYTKPAIFGFLFSPIIILSCIFSGYIAALIFPPVSLEKIKGLTYHSLRDISDIT
ncbi:MAG: sodium:solute symporter family transporter [Brevinema sp.]